MLPLLFKKIFKTSFSHNQIYLCDMETLNECPICYGQDFEPFIKCIDYTVSKETFQIVQCKKCDFKFTNPRPSQSEIGKYYESEYYISHSNSKKGLFNLVYQTN